MVEYRLSDDPIPQELLDEQEKLSIWNTHKVYFDNDSGDILAISNEELPQYQYFFNLPVEQSYLLENERLEDYKVSFDNNEVPTIILKPKQDESALILVKVIEESGKNSELILEKNLKFKKWRISLREDKKEEYLKMGINTKLEFFIVDANNKNILIRKMAVLLTTLCNSEQTVFDFISHREELKTAEVYCKKFFTSINLKVTYDK